MSDETVSSPRAFSGTMYQSQSTSAAASAIRARLNSVSFPTASPAAFRQLTREEAKSPGTPASKV
jgi:hypothetical protein